MAYNFRTKPMRFDPIVRPEMPELDTVRGVAVLLVVFYHGYFWMTGLSGFMGISRLIVAATMPGWLGVNLFFVLSGFLITGILLDTRSKQDYFRSFYVKRALRILPAYYGILLVLLIAGFKPRSFLVLSLFFLSNVAPLFGIVPSYSVLWSLAVEEHFYILWPALVRGCSIRALENCAIGITFAVPVLRACSFMLGLTGGIHGYTWCEADGLAAGAWLAINVRKPGFTRKRLTWVSAFALAIGLFAVLVGMRFGILTRQRLLGASLQESCFNFLFLGIIGTSLLIGTSGWKSLVRRPILRFYGRISYGLYLIHLLIFGIYNRNIQTIWQGLPSPAGRLDVVTFRFVVCMSISTALAFLSRQYFEEPFLRMRHRFVRTDVNKIQSPVFGEPTT